MTRTTVTLLLSLAALGCSGSGRVNTVYAYHADPDPVSNQPAHVVPGPMPDGESFTGSYHSQQLGDLYLEQQGDTVVGQYEYDRAACHATGRIEGRATGNLLRFSWTESQASCGRLAPITGHAYFLFWKDPDQNGRLNGEWGFGENDSGNGRWSAFRDRVRRQAPSRQGGNGSGGSIFEDANPSSGGGSSGGSTSGQP